MLITALGEHRFIVPTAYFLYKRRLTSPNRIKFLALSLGIGFQGFLGWYMVKSGLSEEILTTPGAVPRVSQYRLAAHLSAALLLYAGMLATAVGINGDAKFAKHGEAGLGVKKGFWEVKEVRRFARWSKVVTALVLFTAASGESLFLLLTMTQLKQFEQAHLSLVLTLVSSTTSSR